MDKQSALDRDGGQGVREVAGRRALTPDSTSSLLRNRVAVFDVRTGAVTLSLSAPRPKFGAHRWDQPVRGGERRIRRALHRQAEREARRAYQRGVVRQLCAVDGEAWEDHGDG